MKIHVRGLLVMRILLVISSIIVLNSISMTSGHENSNGRDRGDAKLKWSRAAAEEAEAVASIKCSGHGRAYLDGLPIEGKPACQCNSCYSGDDCSVFLPNCSVDSNSGNPLFLEPYWMKNEASSAVVVSGWHRMGYSYEDGSYISRELEKVIRRLHKVVGNANTDGKYILFGAGSTQLLNAAIVGLSTPNHTFSPANVVASIPFYQVYKQQTDIYNSLSFKWKGNASLWKNNSDSTKNFIEFVTSPNNPDGRLMKPVLKGSSAKTVYDYAYYWPHFTGISSPVDTDLMIFTISKLTGHAGSRFGWAFVKDRALYERMENYLDINSIGSSHDTQLRALVLLKSVLKDKARGLFEFGHSTIRKRWVMLNRSFSKSNRFTLQKLRPRYCSFFKKVTNPSPAYGWLKCERKEDQDCPAVLRAAGVIGRNGTAFGASNKYVRLSIIRSQFKMISICFCEKSINWFRKTKLFKLLFEGNLAC